MINPRQAVYLLLPCKLRRLGNPLVRMPQRTVVHNKTIPPQNSEPSNYKQNKNLNTADVTDGNVPGPCTTCKQIDDFFASYDQVVYDSNEKS